MKDAATPEYTRQVITVKKTFYERLRRHAQGDEGRVKGRLRIGDVIEAAFTTLDEVPQAKQAFQERLGALELAASMPVTREQVKASLTALFTKEELRQMLEDAK